MTHHITMGLNFLPTFQKSQPSVCKNTFNAMKSSFSRWMFLASGVFMLIWKSLRLYFQFRRYTLFKLLLICHYQIVVRSFKQFIEGFIKARDMPERPFFACCEVLTTRAAHEWYSLNLSLFYHVSKSYCCFCPFSIQRRRNKGLAKLLLGVPQTSPKFEKS